VCVEYKVSVLLLQAHMEAVHADWKEYLNLLICEENHLKHMDEYHKVRHRAMGPHTRLQTAVADCVCVCVCSSRRRRVTLKTC